MWIHMDTDRQSIFSLSLVKPCEKKTELILSGEERREGGRLPQEVDDCSRGRREAAQPQNQINMFATKHKAGLCPALPS